MRRRNSNETPEQRFKRIATLRTNAILNKIKILGKLSDKRRYVYSEKEIRRIFSAINAQVKETRARFESGKEERFKL